MDRTERLFRLMDCLRQHRRPVTAARLAEQLSVSVRTIYRDIQSLIALGASIDGEAGMGYQLRAGFFLPPLMFDDIELEALVLGARWVAEQGDEELVRAANNVLAKVATSSPRDLRERIAGIGLVAWSACNEDTGTAFLRQVREAIRRELVVTIDYTRADGEISQRTVWPVMLAFFERTRMLVAWCELRGAFRHFRLDRLNRLDMGEGHYPRRRSALLREWRKEMKIPE
ncbi:putative transcriptional regulator [Isoalcanivorax pacificus W11-5]|uniref:Putative transcriptional regulator n=1 Tax=Isoalcanivorax pacificus W11-5 TaxID=391936 RepID=A0A0B4XRQ1_9GAMM|nr:YafY family protein [Isoalcanivorax pacificus]AJD49876.1 putative transcriptional regulator [Isoalcanivorax pacificus W11-5]